MAALHADLEQARLSKEVAAGTALEAIANEAMQYTSERWAAASSELQARAGAWEPRSQQIEARLAFLQRSLDEGASRAKSLQGWMLLLRGVYDQAHAQHGEDERSRIEQEFATLAERRAAIVQQL